MSKLNEKIQSLIKKEGLDESRVFFDNYSTFEEIPLFSRWSHINFLKEYEFNTKNKILLKLTMSLIHQAVSEAQYITRFNFNEYFICASVIKWDNIEELGCISPNIFISRRKTWILPLLRLREFESPETEMLKTYLEELNITGKTICVSTSYGNEEDRIYIVDDCFLT